MFKNIGILLLVLLVTSNGMANDETHISSYAVGSAYKQNSMELVYFEQYQHLADRQTRVIYKETDGSVFAEKLLDYRKSTIAPSFTQTNSRAGETISASTTNNQVMGSYQSMPDKAGIKKTIALTNNTVIDAGFDNFVRKNWATLTQGQEVIFEFYAPSKIDTYNLVIKRQTCKENLCLSVKPRNWIAKMIVAPLKLQYDINTRQLKKFSGRSNICDADGKYAKVDIYYEYHNNLALR